MAIERMERQLADKDEEIESVKQSAQIKIEKNKQRHQQSLDKLNGALEQQVAEISALK